MDPLATVIIPTFDHADTLYASARSVLKQSVKELELFIIGDGVPERTRAIVSELMAEDDRVHFFDHPKSPRTGEPYRHEALQEARGRIVCYLADDDLYFPDHVEHMLELLADADFAHVLPLYFDHGEFHVLVSDLSYEPNREVQRKGLKGRFGLGYGAHTMEFYRKLPFGWRTTPAGFATDQYMWQQCLSVPDCRATSSNRATVVRFPAPTRIHMTPQERLRELEQWLALLHDPIERENLRDKSLNYAVRTAAREIADLTLEFAQLQQKIAELSTELHISKEQGFALISEKARVESEHSHLQQRTSHLEQQNSHLGQQNGELERELHHLKEQSNLLTEQLNVWQTSHAVQEETVQRWEQSNVELQSRVAAYEQSRARALARAVLRMPLLGAGLKAAIKLIESNGVRPSN